MPELHLAAADARRYYCLMVAISHAQMCVRAFAIIACGLGKFSYKYVDGNASFDDQPLTNLKIKCLQS